MSRGGNLNPYFRERGEREDSFFPFYDCVLIYVYLDVSRFRMFGVYRQTAWVLGGKKAEEQRA